MSAQELTAIAITYGQQVTLKGVINAVNYLNVTIQAGHKAVNEVALYLGLCSRPKTFKKPSKSFTRASKTHQKAMKKYEKGRHFEIRELAGEEWRIRLRLAGLQTPPRPASKGWEQLYAMQNDRVS